MHSPASRFRLIAALAASALLVSCGDSSDADLEAYQAEQDAAVSEIADMLQDSYTCLLYTSDAADDTASV